VDDRRSPVQWVPGTLSQGVERSWCEVDHSSPSSAEVKMRGAVPPCPKPLSWRGAYFSTGTPLPPGLKRDVEQLR
jgi:hypothetical protein